MDSYRRFTGYRHGPLPERRPAPPPPPPPPPEQGRREGGCELLVLAMLWVLYRNTRDQEFLLLLAVLFLLWFT